MATWLAVACIAIACTAPAARAEWLAPVAISPHGEHVGTPDVALDSQGNATAVWDRWNGSETLVESAYRPAGEPWGEAEVLGKGSAAQVVVDRNGYLTVVWERYGWPTMSIESASRAPEGSWSEPVEIAEMPQGSSPEPWLAVDWEGNSTAVWKQGEVIMSSFRTFAGSWGEPVPLSGSESFTPQAAMDARGDATAVWMHHDGSDYVVESAYRPEQGEWGEPELVSQPGEDGGNPHVAIDAEGDVLVVWRGEDEGEERLRAAYRPAGGSWGAPVDVSGAGEQVESPRAAVDPQGNAIAAWSGSSGEVGGWGIVHASYKPAAGGWEAPVALSSEGGNSFPADVVFDSSGNAALLWQRWDGVENLVQAVYKPAGEEWEPAVDLSEEGTQGMDSVVVLDAPGTEVVADGDATAIWTSAKKVTCEAVKPEPPCWSYEVQAAGYDPDGAPELAVEVPAEGEVGEPVAVSTLTEGLYSPLIEFGDGESVPAIEATHTYEVPGEYEVVAGGAEELGYRATAARTITIRGAGEGPGSEGPGGGEPGGEQLGGGDPDSGPAGASQVPPPADSPPSAAGCTEARAAAAGASRRLRRIGNRLKAANSPQRRRLLAAKRRQLASLRDARARIASLC
jgi:hypothetical protein